jgi:hypothetical protein
LFLVRLLREGQGASGRLWTEFHRIAEAVRFGRLDPAHVANAYHQAMAPRIERRGAKFWAALCCLTGLDTYQLRELATPP